MRTWLRRVGSEQRSRALRAASRAGASVAFEVATTAPAGWGARLDTFVTEAGVELPVYADYRYTVRDCHDFLWSFKDLTRLAGHGVLTDDERRRLRALRGTRTLGGPPSEAVALLEAVREREPARFLNRGELAIDTPSLHPDEVDARKVDEQAHDHGRVLRQVGVALDPDATVLEIGYTSGGHSLAAFADVARRVIGVDNFYDGEVRETTSYIDAVLGGRSNVDLLVADAAAMEQVPSGSVDLVYTQSVLEHLSDPGPVFAELRRVLKPSGAMVHVWEPFGAAKGGHRPGIPDAPYGHLCLAGDDVGRYFATYRPDEHAYAVSWIETALNRLTAAEILGSVERSGFAVAAYEGEHDQVVLAPGSRISDYALAAGGADLGLRRGVLGARPA